jgi:hypothetical protein
MPFTQTRPLAFIDNETLGRIPSVHPIFETAYILRRPDGTVVRRRFLTRPSAAQLARAEPKALEVNRYHSRFVGVEPHRGGTTNLEATFAVRWSDPKRLAAFLAVDLEGIVLIGSNTGFDAGHMSAFQWAHGQEPTWFYRTQCAPLLAAQRLQLLGHDVPVDFSTAWVAQMLGVERPKDNAHQAMPDAEFAMALYDAAVAPLALPVSA